MARRPRMLIGLGLLTLALASGAVTDSVIPCVLMGGLALLVMPAGVTIPRRAGFSRRAKWLVAAAFLVVAALLIVLAPSRLIGLTALTAVWLIYVWVEFSPFEA